MLRVSQLRREQLVAQQFSWPFCRGYKVTDAAPASLHSRPVEGKGRVFCSPHCCLMALYGCKRVREVEYSAFTSSVVEGGKEKGEGSGSNETNYSVSHSLLL